MMNDLHHKILSRVVDMSGGTENLAKSLGVSHSTLLLWTQGKATIPQEVVAKLVDTLLAADVASLVDAARQTQAKPLPRILVVDDDPSGAYGLARVVKQLGYPVETAGDGPSALELARKFKPEVVFVDLRMPGMDGVEVAALLKSEGLAVHIIAATAYRSELERARTTTAGFAGHLLKPVDKRALEDLLTHLR
jgi:CheY-like chemotaxis protein